MKENGKKPDILYEDGNILVIKKPAYFPVQSAAAGKPDCVSFLKNHLYKNGNKKEPYIAVIHRLDEPVEGILVFAKNKKTAAVLSSRLQSGIFEKRYTAAVEKAGTEKKDPDADILSGAPGEKGRLTDWMIKERSGNISRIVPEGTEGAKKAELIYEKKEDLSFVENERYLLDIRLLTGRHHQIRVQLKNAGYPIIGDRKYGNTENTDLPLCLCADRLAFEHPETHEMMKFQIEPSFLEII